MIILRAIIYLIGTHSVASLYLLHGFEWWVDNVENQRDNARQVIPLFAYKL